MDADLKPLLRRHIEALVLDERQIEEALDEMAPMMPAALRGWFEQVRAQEEAHERAKLAAASALVAAGILRGSKPAAEISPDLWAEVVFDACDLPALAEGDLWLTEFAAQSLQYALACDSDEEAALPSVAPGVFSAVQRVLRSWDKQTSIEV